MRSKKNVSVITFFDKTKKFDLNFSFRFFVKKKFPEGKIEKIKFLEKKSVSCGSRGLWSEYDTNFDGMICFWNDNKRKDRNELNK